MIEALTDIWDSHFWTALALATAVIVAISIFAERRRSRREHIEDVGFMPWIGITVLGTLITVASIALAIKSEFLG